MKISIVVAAAENGVIGAAGDIPWKLPDDQRRFKSLTLGHHIVMGRLTHESIGRLLPGRTTIVVSSNPDYAVEGAHVAHSLDDALDYARDAGESDLFVVGGERIYALALPLADTLHVTRVHTEIPGDTHFASTEDLHTAGFTLTTSEHHPPDPRHPHPYTFETWTR